MESLRYYGNTRRAKTEVLRGSVDVHADIWRFYPDANSDPAITRIAHTATMAGSDFMMATEPSNVFFLTETASFLIMRICLKLSGISGPVQKAVISERPWGAEKRVMFCFTDC